MKGRKLPKRSKKAVGKITPYKKGENIPLIKRRQRKRTSQGQKKPQKNVESVDTLFRKK